MNLFSEFSNLYELSKTLRFELKPIGNTAELLKQNQVFEKDKLIDDNYHKIKYYFDILHREFIQDALQEKEISSFDFLEYWKIFQAEDIPKNKANKDNPLYKQENELRKQVVKCFHKKAKDWFQKLQNMKVYKEKKDEEEDKENKNPLKFLFEKDNIKILRKLFQKTHDINRKNGYYITFTHPSTGEIKKNEEEEVPDIEYIHPITKKIMNLFQAFEGYHTYLTNFNLSRENFYSEKDDTTAISNRIINENLRRFCQNKKTFENRKEDYEKLGFTDEEKEIFDLDFYKKCFIQDGIDEYNMLIGRKAKDEGGKGLNQKINEYCQQNKNVKLLRFKQLDKQILSEKDKQAGFIDITSDEQVFEILKIFLRLNEEKMRFITEGYTDESGNRVKGLFYRFIENQDDFEDLGKIFIKQAPALNTIAGKFFGDNSQYFKDALPHKKTTSKEETYKLDDFISIQNIKDALQGKQPSLPKNYEYRGKIEMEPKNLFREGYKNLLTTDNYQSFLNVWKYEFEKCLKSYSQAKENIETMMASGKYKKEDLQNQKIHDFFESAIEIYRIMKYFALEKEKKKVELTSDGIFYPEFEKYYNDFNFITYYNEFRNYLTKKNFLGRLLFPSLNGKQEQRHPFSKRKTDGAEKIRLSFEKGGRPLQGWSDSPKGNTQYFGFIFRKEGKYFLGITNTPRLLDEKQYPEAYKISPNEDIYEKMTYSQSQYNAHYDITKIYYSEKYNSNFEEDSKRTSQGELIKRLKHVMSDHSEDDIRLETIASAEYSNLKQLIEKIRRLNKIYKIDFNKKVTAEFLLKMATYEESRDEKLYLFEITNRDFKSSKDGKENLHTTYFKLLFNNNDNLLKLDGNGTIYFRPNIPNIEKKEIITKKNNILIKKGEKPLYHQWRYLDLKGKILFHPTIKLNFGSFEITNKNREYYYYQFNRDLNSELLSKNADINVIGIDRGEKHLAYYSVIRNANKKGGFTNSGTILESGTFNTIDVLDTNGKIIRTVDYLKLLEEKTGSRDEARKNWKTIENIKELKKGYISQVVRKICDLILKYNAIVVFEDLSIGFKRGRMKIEKQVYQKLELDLARKLNYLVNKNEKEGNAGHYLKAYQLTPPVQNFGDIKKQKQCGVIFYTVASYTSKTCPVCGFRRDVYRTYESDKKTKEFFELFEDIHFDGKDFVFTYDSAKLEKEDSKNQKKKQKRIEEKKPRLHIIKSNVKRIRWFKKEDKKHDFQNNAEKIIARTEKGYYKEFDVTWCLKLLFQEKIKLDKNIKKQIEESGNFREDFYKSLLFYFNLLLEIRNSATIREKEVMEFDYISCSACNFHSDNDFQGKLFNGDANGAYNIARKGILILKKIKEHAKKDPKFELKGKDGLDLFISNDEWDKFTQRPLLDA